MKKKCQNIQREQKLREIIFAVTEIVFEMIPFGFEGIVVFILYFPAASAYQSYLVYIGVCNLYITDEGSAVFLLECSGIGDFQCYMVYPQCILAAIDGYGIDISVIPDFFLVGFAHNLSEAVFSMKPMCSYIIL